METNLKKVILVGLGLAVQTKEKAAQAKEKLEEAVKILMDKGRMNEQEARTFIDNIVIATNQKRQEIKKIIKAEVNRVAKKIERATRIKKEKIKK